MRYRQMVAELLRAKQASEAGQDELSIILDCLVHVRHFIDSDPEVAKLGLMRPLEKLSLSLRDLAQGSRPPLFFEQPKRVRQRPKDTSFHAVQGAAAAVVTMLMNCGEARGTAGTIVADELRRAGIKAPGGKSISSTQVLRWRDEMGGRAAALAQSTYKDTCAALPVAPPADCTDPSKWRHAFAVNMIAGIRSKRF